MRIEHYRLFAEEHTEDYESWMGIEELPSRYRQR